MTAEGVINFKNDPSLPFVVQKYGGTSVGKFPMQIIDIVKSYLKKARVAVVLSARSSECKTEGTTSRLLEAASQALVPDSVVYKETVELIRKDHINAARSSIVNQKLLNQLIQDINSECDGLSKFLEAAQIVNEITPRTKDSIMSVGEKLSALYMASLLNDRGVDAQYIFLDQIIPINYKLSKSGLDQDFYDFVAEGIASEIQSIGDKVPVITGYFGTVPGSLLNSVGRGYTDLCAALTAVGLNASELQVWKEVDGIFTADPRKVPEARLLPFITPDEAAELTYYGSEVIHPFTMEQVIRARIPIRIKNVENPSGRGTIIFPDNESRKGEATPPHPPTSLTNINEAYFISQKKEPTAVTTKQDIVVINIHSNKRTLSHGFLASIFTILDEQKLVVDLISTSEVHVSMALHTDVHSKIIEAVTELRTLGNVDVMRKMCIVSLVGKNMKQLIGIAGKMFTTLADAGINIEMISQGASEINISCVVQEADAVKALNLLHKELIGNSSLTNISMNRPWLLE